MPKHISQLYTLSSAKFQPQRSTRPLPVPLPLAHSPHPSLFPTSFSTSVLVLPLHMGRQKRLLPPWNRKLKFETSRKELGCKPDLFLMPSASVVDLSREFTGCNGQDHMSSHTLGSGVILPATRVTSTVLLKCSVDPRRELLTSLLIVTKLTSEGDSDS